MPGDDVEDAAMAPPPPPAAPRKKFPTPSYVVVIYSKVVVTVDRADRRVSTVWDNHLLPGRQSPNPNPKNKKRKVRVKMQSLLVKMVNRLVREEIIPAEAVSIVAGSTFISIRILVASSAVPVIMLRCERIGVGNVVGTVHACPLETSLVPPAMKKEVDMVVLNSGGVSQGSPSATKKEIDMVVLNSGGVGQGSPATVATTKSGVPTFAQQQESAGASLPSVNNQVAGENGDDEDADEISDSDDNEEEDECTSKVPSSVDIPAFPLMSLERKKRLQEAIIKARSEWRNSSSRVRVMQVIEEVTAGASFTFDYALFVVCAGLIAGAGLAIDSGATVIASMLVSPIMGPVMAMTFGTTVRSIQLIKKGFRNESFSLLICFLTGAITCVLAVVGETPNKRDWPSEEMLSRGDVNGLLAGIYIAIPSGVAVALSTLGKNSSGLVGVAISLSLLPPAVNAAMCWTYELLLMSSAFDRNEGDTTDYWYVGGISFALTLINILCIWIAGTFTFWLKEVAPLQEKNAFWKAFFLFLPIPSSCCPVDLICNSCHTSQALGRDQLRTHRAVS